VGFHDFGDRKLGVFVLTFSRRSIGGRFWSLSRRQ
jgi:hypothetical protein